MIIFFAVSIVALKAMSDPFSSVSFKVIRLSTLVLVKAESSVFLIASLKVNVMLSVTGTRFSVSTGSKTIVGEIVSTTVKVIELSLIALSDSSSTGLGNLNPYDTDSTSSSLETTTVALSDGADFELQKWEDLNNLVVTTYIYIS